MLGNLIRKVPLHSQILIINLLFNVQIGKLLSSHLNKQMLKDRYNYTLQYHYAR